MEHWDSLCVGLPEDILKAKWAGDFQAALRLIDERLKDTRLPESLRRSLETQKTVIARLPVDYPYTREETLAIARERIPGFTEEEFDAFELQGKLDYIYCLGEKRYFRRAVNTLIKTEPDIAARAGKPLDPSGGPLGDVVEKVISRGEVKYHVRMRHSVIIEDSAFSSGERYTVHIPIPMPSAQISDIRILTREADMFVAPPETPQRTVCFRRSLTENAPFSVEYEYDIVSRYVDTSGPCPGVLYPDAAPVTGRDTEELPPHILFTPYMKRLARELTSGAADPMEKARRFYDFCTTKVRYSFMRSYLTIENGSEYAALNLKGDCGIQALCFITLCRIAGIPARWQAGLCMEPGDVGNHDWAQFYIDGWGWLFADCSFGGSAWRRGDLKRWNFYFGNLEPWRMVSNSDYQQDFNPPKAFTRADPYDNQCGEVETDTRALTGREFDCEWDLIELNEI